MPYIKQERRRTLSDMSPIANAGEMNYSFTKIIVDYLDLKGESYQTYNDIIGALEGAKLELYARKVTAYEKLKTIENGDVY